MLTPRIDYTAQYACKPEQTKGRLFVEHEKTERTDFQRDRDRIVHSTAFRRLQYKTQVFVYHEGDHHRNRLTHSLEVAQITRSICRSLRLNEDLAEAIALAHDLGHPPFGHAGEKALHKAMLSYGGFDHNAQTFKVLTKLERKYARHHGLNLTWETLEGVVKHNGPLIDEKKKNLLPEIIQNYQAKQDLKLYIYPSAEAQLASICDDIAYNNHDIDDGLRAGYFSVEDIQSVSLFNEAYEKVKKKYPDIEAKVLICEIIRYLIDIMVADVFHESQNRLKTLAPNSADDIRNHKEPVIAFSPEMGNKILELKNFLQKRLYQHYQLKRMSNKAERVINALFDLFVKDPTCLPPEWQILTDGPDTSKTAHAVADYIACMTDRSSQQEYDRLFGSLYFLN